MKNILQVISIICSFLILNNASACEHDDFDSWKKCFITDKLENKFDEKVIKIFEKATFIPKVITLDKKQPEKKLTYQQYQKLIAINDKIAKARSYLKNNLDDLKTVSEEYEVEPEIIVALIAMESDLGERQGNFNIIDSLATLAYEGRRKTFFENELIHALKIAEENNLEYEVFNGSWAGAMGQCQFMPSSYRNFAVNYDKHEHADIWHSKLDVFASAANYLAKNGWKKGNNQFLPLNKNHKNFNEYSNFYQSNCSSNSELCSYNDNQNLLFLNKDVINAPGFIVGNNIKILMKWNKSYYFSLSVLNIANSIKTS
jgi:membrane-bound lytic murein transglycosylase B